MAVQGSVHQRLDLSAATESLKLHFGVTSFFGQLTKHRTPEEPYSLYTFKG